ncbi:MAG: endonuclease/exonuclease/phosphatase family protein [Candidatus Sigynarchaeota archaeon]
MSFNAHASSLPTKKHGWAKRRQLVIDVVKKYQPDVVGFQEVQRDQLDDLVKGLDGYGCHHQGWQDVSVKQELLPIFYVKERVAIIKSGAFWLNKTPDVPRIDEGGGEVLRACTWMHAKVSNADGNDRTFAVYHAHFDHQKEWRREAAARLVLDHIAAQSAGIPAVLFGDLNTRPGSTTYAILQGRFRDAFVDSPTPRGAQEITCHCFTGATKKSRFRPAFQWIDHVLMDKDVTCVKSSRILDSGGNPRIYPSDHYPVLAELL